jgi:hypothetical protein
MCTNNYLIIWVAPKKTISDDPDGLDHILMINFSNWAVCLGQLIWRYLDQHFPSLMIATNYFSIRLWSNSDHLFVTWKTRRISRTDSETIHSRWVFTKLLESRFMADSDRPLLGVQSFDLPFGISLKKTHHLWPVRKGIQFPTDFHFQVRLVCGIAHCRGTCPQDLVGHHWDPIRLAVLWWYFCPTVWTTSAGKYLTNTRVERGSLYFPILGIFCITLWLNDGKPPHKGWRLWGTCKEPCWIFKLTRQHQNVGLDMFDARIGGWPQPPNPSFSRE